MMKAVIINPLLVILFRLKVSLKLHFGTMMEIALRQIKNTIAPNNAAKVTPVTKLSIFCGMIEDIKPPIEEKKVIIQLQNTFKAGII